MNKNNSEKLNEYKLTTNDEIYKKLELSINKTLQYVRTIKNNYNKELKNENI